MKPYIRLAAAVVLGAMCLLIGPRKSATQVKVVTQEEPKHYAWLVERLREVESIRVGMSRADLLKVFEPDGGLSGALPERYVLRSCSLIKVDVRFDTSKGTTFTPLPPDTGLKITAISKPYLEPMYMD
jgi:hypothetical protein